VIELTEHREGIILRVRAQPGASRNAVLGSHGGALKISVTSPPEKGKANAAISEVLCEVLGLRHDQVVLLGGAGSRNKRFLIRGLTPAQLHAQLAVD